MTQPDKIKNLIDYFAVVRQRPGIYLGTNTMSKLAEHLQGYQTSSWINDIKNSVDQNFFENFNDFVYSYYEITSNESWKTIILAQCLNDEQLALAKFFELFDLFIGEHKTTSSRKIVFAIFDELVFNQKEMRNKLGDDFTSILYNTIDLFKDNLVSDYKSDYDAFLEQLNENADEIPRLKLLLKELENRVS